MTTSPTTSARSPLVSICIPAFNAEKTIVQCLRSVLEQQVEDAEIVLVDNCSTDRTVALAEEILKDITDCRVVHNSSNLGRIGNWNRCLEIARGKFVKFVFTNDALLPGALKHFVQVMEGDRELVMAGSRQRTVSTLPEVLPIFDDEIVTTVRNSGDAVAFLAKDGFASLGSLNGMIYRRSVIIGHGLRFREDLPYFADFIHAMELASHGKVAFLETESYLFNEGATGRYHFAGLKCIPKFLAEHRACTNRQMQLLRTLGRPEQPALDYLWGRYFWYLGQGWKISPIDALRTFRGFPVLQLQATLKTAWFLVRKFLSQAGQAPTC